MTTKINKRQMFLTTDGKYHNTKEKAMYRQKYLDHMEYVERVAETMVDAMLVHLQPQMLTMAKAYLEVYVRDTTGITAEEFRLGTSPEAIDD